MAKHTLPTYEEALLRAKIKQTKDLLVEMHTYAFNTLRDLDEIERVLGPAIRPVKKRLLLAVTFADGRHFKRGGRILRRDNKSTGILVKFLDARTAIVYDEDTRMLNDLDLNYCTPLGDDE